MLARLLPRTLSVTDRIDPVAWWLFLPIMIMSIGRSLVHVLRSDGGAQSIATVPLDRMGGGGAEAVVSVFALWGLSQLLLAVVGLIALVRYRGLVPLLYVLIFVEYVGRTAIAWMKPLPTLETPPGAIGNLVLPVLALIGLGFSLRRRGAAGTGAAG